ncbi:hypothetical protein RB620_21495 [Paenibacillus sp. LHD-117]|uniref:hypothetical protein n=1 Tax=Paenibacillus sp. LHD-117 TaxID=3071412 RepID=UPI0027E02CB2|nr:hypothetical protein [Paenibacillus sp. LHD-117]MDQ6422008.1 hypothetical protein [Paenibacillus sp. LHD-117]
MRGIRLQFISGGSSILGGIAFAFLGAAWAITHGSTAINRQAYWLGLGNLQFSQLNIVYSVLFIIGLSAFWKMTVKENKWAITGYRIAFVCLCLELVSQILQYHIVSPIRDVEATVVTIGFLIFWLSWLLFSLGMVILGLSMRLHSKFYRISFVLIGVFQLAAFCTEFFLISLLYDSTSVWGVSVWDVILGSVKVPFSLVWMILGAKLLLDRKAI